MEAFIRMIQRRKKRRGGDAGNEEVLSACDGEDTDVTAQDGASISAGVGGIGGWSHYDWQRHWCSGAWGGVDGTGDGDSSGYGGKEM